MTRERRSGSALPEPSPRRRRPRQTATPTSQATAAALTFAAWSSFSSFAAAQQPTLVEPSLVVPGRSLAGTSDATATALNPANLAFLPSIEARWLWTRTTQDSEDKRRGHSFDLATPLFLGFSAGGRVDLVRPPDDSFAPRYQLWTGALAWGSKKTGTAIGVSQTRSVSDTRAYDAHRGTTFSFTTRATRFAGLAGVVRNAFDTQNRAGVRLERSWEGGLSIFPLGTRTLEIAGELRYLEHINRTSPKAIVGLDVPHVGRLRADVEVHPNDGYLATVGLDINDTYAQAMAGGMFGKGFGQGAYMGLALRGFREPGLPTARQYVKIRLEDTPGVRSHVKLLRMLWRIAESDEASGVVLQLKAEPSSSTAHSEELGDAIRKLKARGKKVVCHLESGGGRALHVCAGADRIVINPAGGIRFSGLKSQYLYYGDALSKFGVRSEFVRIGTHKTAAESLTNHTPTDVAFEDHEELLRETEHTMLSDIGGGRKIPFDELKARIAKGPFVAKEAREAGLVDSYAFDDDIEAVASEVEGHSVKVVSASKANVFAPRLEATGARAGVAVIYLDGDMIDGRSQDIPLVGRRLAGSYTIADAFKAARENPLVRSVVFRIETGGGSSLAAEIINREVTLTAKKKPVIVSMGAAAASGGYYVAAPGTKLFANRATITGSIGIFYGKADVAGLLGKIGVGVETHRSAPRADAESYFRPFTDEERVELGKKVKIFYDTFVDRVARGRSLSAADVDAVARGKVWTGEQAKQRKLVDEIGGFREAIEEAERVGEVPHGAPLVELPEPSFSLLNTVLELSGFTHAKVSASAPATIDRPILGDDGDVAPLQTAVPIPRDLLRVMGALVPFTVWSADTPLAAREALVVEEP
jgi:protease IV